MLCFFIVPISSPPDCKLREGRHLSLVTSTGSPNYKGSCHTADVLIDNKQMNNLKEVKVRIMQSWIHGGVCQGQVSLLRRETRPWVSDSQVPRTKLPGRGRENQEVIWFIFYQGLVNSSAVQAHRRGHPLWASSVEDSCEGYDRHRWDRWNWSSDPL